MNIENIPAELRWEIAAKSASAMPFAQERVYRAVLGEKYKKIEPMLEAADFELRIESGKQISNMAKELGLPYETAEDVDNTQSIASKILLGPELKYETVKSSSDQVQTHITGCPVLNRAREMEVDTEFLFDHCVAQNKSTVENLNPKYTQRITKAMCRGDPYCETCTELKKSKLH
ncbi:hypothetical protein [Methanobacterium oryzae]|uniref:hypothetical protein n=1 Tax=Methanobacterium oryzae TaxID=69540 RepID=UPI003D22FC8F